VLAAWLHGLLTPASRAARRQGHLSQAVALWSRAHRQRRAWADHEARCQAQVRRAVAACESRRTVAVLGSGLWRDVPVDELAGHFARVVLVDVVHLASIRRRLARSGWRHVALIERDLSGFTEIVENGAAHDPLAFLHDLDGLDLVISANLLSQIVVHARDRLGIDITPDPRLRALVEAHLHGLARLRAPALLLSDVSYELRDRAGQVLEREDLMQGAALPRPLAAWDWPVAPFGEIARDVESIHRVAAFEGKTLAPAAPKS
jgi:hypothetical protein